MRTAIGAVILIALLAVIGRACGDDPEDDRATPRITFVSSARSLSDAERAKPAALKAEEERIVALLETWYQRAFVDPKAYGDGTFPEVAELFTAQARDAFEEQRDVLTIGEAREQVTFVEPETASARIAVFFEKGKTPRWARAFVNFRALATLEDGDVHPLRITQRVRLTLQRTKDGWRITYWDRAHQRQATAEPTPTPEPSS